MLRARRSPVLVGRAREQARLDGLLAEAGEGSPAFAVVSGIAGVGKSRLISDWIGTAGPEVSVVAVDCQPAYDGPAPLTPILQLLDALHAARVLPADRPRPTPAAGNPMALSVARALGAVAASLSRPVVVVVEDVHWADSTTLACLAHLDRLLRRSAAPLLVVLTFRAGDPSTPEVVRSFVEEELRSPLAELIELSPLDDEESRQLVRALLGPSTPRDVVVDLAGRGDGVPLWIEQIARSWPAVEVPASARVAFGHRLRRLLGHDRRVIAALAVAGSAGDEFLFAVSQPMHRHEFLDACQRLVDDGFVTVGSNDVYALGHTLLREVVRDGIVPVERRRLHDRVAGWLATSDPPASAAIARHYESAGRRRDTVRWAFRAALEAEQRGAVHESVSLLSLTIAMWADVADAEQIVGEKLWEVEERLAAHCAAVGDYDTSTRILMELLEQEWAPRVLQPHDVARLETAIAFQVVNWSPEHAWPHVDRAWSLVAGSEGDPDPDLDPDLVPVLSRLVRIEIFGGRPADHRDLAEALVDVAHRADDARAVAEAQLALGAVLQSAADFHAAAGALRAAADVLKASGGSRQLLNDALVNLSECVHRSGDLDGAAASALDGVEELSRSGDAASLVNLYLLHNAAYSAFKLGRWAEAERLWREVRTYGRGADDAVHLLPAPLLLARGETDEVARIVERHSAAAESSPELARYYLEVKAELRLAEGRAPAAASAVEDGLRRCLGTEQEMSTGRLLLLGMRAAYARSPVDPEFGTDVAARLVSWSRRAPTSPLGVRAPTSVVTTPAVLAQWRAETARLHGADDVASWSEAATAWQRLGRPHPAAYCWAQAARAAGTTARSRSDVRPLLDRLASVAVPLPAVPIMDEAAEIARSARVSLPATITALLAHQEQSRPFGLSPRELEVVELVAEGLTNRQVAARLFISLSTVSVHLGHAFAKMGVTSRAQATARLLRTAGRPAPG